MALVRGEAARAQDRFGVVEIVALALVAVALGLLWIMQLVMVPSFGQMFADLGGELPAITRAAVGGVIAVGASVLTIALAALGVAIGRWQRGSARWIALGLAVMTPGAAIALLLWAMYAPIFAIAGAIQ
ncbi:MAG: hypothetical protein M3Y87_03075 [Myxococcota bacterium]|nr:hypothetical protein [Myxococcota bacterium]